MTSLTKWIDEMLITSEVESHNATVTLHDTTKTLPEAGCSTSEGARTGSKSSRCLFPESDTDSYDSSSTDDSDWDSDKSSHESTDGTIGASSDEDMEFDNSEDKEQLAKSKISFLDAGYSITWDNTQLHVHTRHQSSENKNKMLLWANSFIANNRVSFRHLADDWEHVPATLVPLDHLLPDQDVFDSVKDRMEIIIERILCSHIRYFGDNCTPVKHVQHQYSEESKQKSKIVNLGVYDADPSSTEGVRKIMDHLHQYVPLKEDGQPHVVPCHGDQLSCERMWEAKRTRSFNQSKKERLLGLEPCPQEFHHRGIALQDTLNLLFQHESLDQRGTLYQLKTAFEHRNVSKKVMDCFNHVTDFLKFVTEGFTVLLALKIMGMDSVDSTPSCPSISCEDIENNLHSVSKEIVQIIWFQVPMSEVASVLDAELTSDTWCWCHEDIDEDMIECSNIHCPFGRWFHVGCIPAENLEIVDGELQAPSGDWWCSIECRESGGSAFCICRKDKGQVVTCANTNCPRGQKFHPECVGLDSAKVTGIWYCSPGCDQDNKPDELEDYLENYSKAVLYRGLLDAVMRDVVREADGNRMMDVWRLNMLDFWRFKHPKYLLQATRLLTGINGWLPPRVAQEMMHNRTANLRGGLGNNIPLDQVNEFMNNEFKEILKHSRGRYTAKHIERASKIAGPMTRELDRILAQNIGEHYLLGASKQQASYAADVKKFVTSYQEYGLFDHVPGREHPAFPRFTYPCHIDRPGQLKKRILGHLADMDRARKAQQQ